MCGVVGEGEDDDRLAPLVRAELDVRLRGDELHARVEGTGHGRPNVQAV